MVRPGGLELPTFWFVARRSIQLSYGRADKEIVAYECRKQPPGARELKRKAPASEGGRYMEICFRASFGCEFEDC